MLFRTESAKVLDQIDWRTQWNRWQKRHTWCQNKSIQRDALPCPDHMSRHGSNWMANIAQPYHVPAHTSTWKTDLYTHTHIITVKCNWYNRAKLNLNGHNRSCLHIFVCWLWLAIINRNWIKPINKALLMKRTQTVRNDAASKCEQYTHGAESAFSTFGDY